MHVIGKTLTTIVLPRVTTVITYIAIAYCHHLEYPYALCEVTQSHKNEHKNVIVEVTSNIVLLVREK